MKKITQKKIIVVLVMALIATMVMSGCGQKTDSEEKNEDSLSENIVITETGEILEKEEPTTVDPELLVEPEQEQIINEANPTGPQGKNLQLVFLGDSILDNNRDETGIPYRTAIQCEADFYNLAIGGTCAAVARDEQIGWEDWTSTSLVGVANAIARNIPSDIFKGKAAKEILDNPNVDFSKTDYFIVEYGMNDFFSAIPLSGESNEGDLKSYAGALRYSVITLKSVAPDATIILCAPNYARFFDGDWMIGDGNSINNGYGTLYDYAGTCEYIAGEQQVLFFDAYLDIGLDGYTAEEYLEDGVHLTDKGRQIYADALAKMILEHEETKNN